MVNSNEKKSKIWGARGSTVGQMRALSLPPIAREMHPVVWPEAGAWAADVTAWAWSQCNCGHTDCAQSQQMASECTPGQKIVYRGIAFVGAQSKPIVDVWTHSEQKRDQEIANLIVNRSSHMDRRKDRRKEAKAPPSTPVKIGDIFYTSWGFDQTNIDFYQVHAVRGAAGMTVDLVELGARVVGGGHGSDSVVAGSPMRSSRDKNLIGKRVTTHNGEPRITIDGHGAYPWKGEPLYQTASGYGH